VLKRLRVKGYKSLADVDVEFGDLTVIAGPNAAGKSNLFDAIGLLGRLGTSQTLKEAFAQHRGAQLEAFRVPDQGIEELANQKAPAAEFMIEADVEIGDDVAMAVDNEIRQMREGLTDTPTAESRRTRIFERRLRYRVVVEIRTDTGLLRVKDESVSALRADGEPSQARKAFFERMGPKLSLRMEGQAHPTYFDLGLDHTLLSRPLYPPHYPHLTALREELARWRVYYFDPEVLRAESPLRHVDSIGVRGEDLAAYINTIQTEHPDQFTSLVQAVKFIIPAIDDVTVQRNREGYLTLSVVENGVPFSARVVSEGTLRVLGLLAISNPDAPTSLVAYEEPENGVHARRLRLVAELLRQAADTKRLQLIINTHSSLLPGYLSDATLFACERTAGATRFRALPNGLFAESEAEKVLDDESYQARVLTGQFGG